VDVLLLVFLLGLSALFSGSETALFSLRPGQLRRLGTQHGPPGHRVVALVENAHRLLSALLIGNLLVNTAASVVATAMCLHYFGDQGLAVAVPTVTLALLVFGEITPKLLALRFQERLALAMPGPELAVEDGTLDETTGHFLSHLLELRELDVREVMTPRPDVVALSRDDSRARILAVAREAGFNRYPVLSPEGGNPVGFIHLKDLLRRDPERPLAANLRPLLFVPDSKDVAALLTQMRVDGVHLAGVVDEHGDFAGIVTLADCLQALIGPVGDVAGLGEAEVSRVGERRWIVSGRLDLRELDAQCGVALPLSRHYVTVAGFVMARLGRLPRQGDRVEVPEAALTVLAMRDNAVLSLEVERFAEEDEEDAR
jgi:putative hemolysin